MTGSARHRYGWLSEVGAASALVLCSSRRLNRELLQAFAELEIDAGRSAWQAPAMYYWRDWCRSTLLASDDDASPRLVDDVASLMVWERSLRGALSQGLLDHGGVARLARSTWQRLADWRVPWEAVERAAATQDESVFAAAAGSYRRTLAERGWLDAAGVPAECLGRLPRLTDPPARVYVAGFDRIPPVVDEILEALEARGCSVERIPAAPPAERARWLGEQAFPERAAELRAAGRWARETLAREPEAKIGIVVTDLHAHAEAYKRLVSEGFAPGWQHGDEKHRAAVDVSFGQRLADYPTIAAALASLRLAAVRLASREVGSLLRSGFFAGSRAAAELDAPLRKLPDRRWTAAALAEAVDRWTEDDADGAIVRDRFRAIAKLAARADDERSVESWVREIAALLTTLGWPGDVPLTSRSYQVQERWNGLLAQVAALGAIPDRLTLAGVVLLLQRLAEDTLFQPESVGGRVRLLGVLEAAGLRFDHLWTAGMEAAQWPPAGQPLALVSRRLQRECGMPDAEPADTLAYAQRVVRRLVCSAREVHFSWAQQAGDSPQQRSPLLDELELTHDRPVADPGWYGRQFLGSAKRVRVAEDPAPPVAERERLHGGTRTLNRHFEDPFSAFAEGRLAATPVDPFEPGLPPRLRGILLHQTLFFLLRDVEDQDAIAGWSASEASKRVRTAAERAFGTYHRHADAVLRRLLALERRRQERVVLDFLTHEAARAAFRIDGVEHSLDYACAGLHLSMRIDRIDRLADGRLLLLDYKSGAPAPFLGGDGEPNDFQLVLYAAALGGDVGGLAMTYLCAPAVAYRGAGAGIPGGSLADDRWRSALQGWIARVERACGEIAAGDLRLKRFGRGNLPPQLDVLSRLAEARRAR